MILRRDRHGREQLGCVHYSPSPALVCPAELSHAPKDACPPGAKRELEHVLSLSKWVGRSEHRRDLIPSASFTHARAQKATVSVWLRACEAHLPDDWREQIAQEAPRDTPERGRGDWLIL